MPHQDDLNLLLEACRQVGPLILQHYKCDLEIQLKPDSSPVTEADLAADTFLKGFLCGARPTYGWLSEETEDDAARLTCERVWVVDPIDGTRAFIKGTGDFCVSLALVEHGEPIIGVVYMPVYDDLYFAVKGQGSFLNGEPIKPAEVKPLRHSTCLTSPREEGLGLFDPYQNMFQSAPVHSIAYKLAKLACGEGDFMITLDKKCEWDTAAGHLLCTESGLKVSTLEGSQVVYNQKSVYLPGLIVAPNHLYAELLSMTPNETV